MNEELTKAAEAVEEKTAGAAQAAEVKADAAAEAAEEKTAEAAETAEVKTDAAAETAEVKAEPAEVKTDAVTEAAEGETAEKKTAGAAEVKADAAVEVKTDAAAGAAEEEAAEETTAEVAEVKSDVSAETAEVRADAAAGAVEEKAAETAEVKTDAAAGAAEEKAAEKKAEKEPEAPVETMDDYKKELEKSYQEYDRRGTRRFVENDSPDAERWQELKQMQDDKTVVKVKIKEIVKGGAIAYVGDTKAFIPASQIALGYVEKLEDWVGKQLETYIITVDPEKKRLVLSARELLRERRDAERKARMSAFKPGDVVEGVVESLKDYGAFVRLDEGVTGLLHVSQISRQRIKHPGVVLQEGQNVKVKIRDIADGKISLTMRNLDSDDAPREEKSDYHYKNSAAVTTSLGDLIKGLKK